MRKKLRKRNMKNFLRLQRKNKRRDNEKFKQSRKN